MLYDLAVDDVFDYLAGDSCKGDGPVVSGVVSVILHSTAQAHSTGTASIIILWSVGVCGG